MADQNNDETDYERAFRRIAAAVSPHQYGPSESRFSYLRWTTEFLSIWDSYKGPCRVYFVAAPATHLIKIGRSVNPARRLEQLRLLSPVPLTLLTSVSGNGDLEHSLHRVFEPIHSHGEWYHATNGLIDFIATISVGANEPPDKLRAALKG